MKPIGDSSLARILLIFVLATAMSTFAVAGSGTWRLTGSLHTARDGHTATLLPNGNVLVAGGENNNQALPSSEVYSPSTGSWTASGHLNIARSNASAVLLPNGQVLVAGGCISNCLGATTASAELYSSASGSWASTGTMKQARAYFGMVLLPNGQVLVAGGCTGLNSNGCSGVTAAAEIYNPSTGKFSSTGAMKVARGSFTLTLLANGQILAAGGINGANNPLGSAELYNPRNGKWTLTGNLNVARDEHTANLLSNGKVLVAGGEDPSGVTTVKTELYNPSTGKWRFTGNLNVSRLEHTATMLMNGNVLIAGGNNVTANNTTVLSSAELYNPNSGVWTKTGNMNDARVGHTATLLSSGQVIAASGSDANNDLTSAEIYAP